MAWFDFGPLPVTKQCRKCHKTFYDYGVGSTCGACPESKRSVGKRSEEGEGSVGKRSEDDDAEHRGDSWGLLLLGLVVGVFFGWWIAGA